MKNWKFVMGELNYRREKAKGERIDENWWRIGEEEEKRKEREKRKSMYEGRRERMNEKYDYMNEKERIVSFIGENISSVMQFFNFK